MAVRGCSSEAIVAAARMVIAESGPSKLRLAAVAAKAGVSRPTLYRWFPTKEDLLAAVAQAEERTFAEGLAIQIDSARTPARRLDVALRYLVTYLDDRTSNPVEADPANAIATLNLALGTQAESLVRSLGAALDLVPAVGNQSLSRLQAAEMFLRMAYSHYLVPHENSEEILSTIRAVVGLPRRSLSRITA